jgi:RNA 2',3'-cyclic 3'-phosphodiesterase
MSSALSKIVGAVRTFLAVELPEQVRAQLAETQRGLAPEHRVLKVSNPELLHITLRFLENVAAQDLVLVVEAAREAAARTTPFAVTLCGVGAFPNARSPRVIWAGLAPDGGTEQLRRLASELDTALSARGFSRPQRPFAAHITLARLRDTAGPEDRRRIGALLPRVSAGTPVDVSFEVHAVTVMRSDLGPAGPSYTPLAVAALRPGDAG